MEEKKLTPANIQDVFNKIKNGDESVYGKYLFKDFKILVTRKEPFSTNERSRKFYNERRAKGLCIICGEKVKNKNPLTNKLFRYCEVHRKQENDARKKRRGTKTTKNSIKSSVKKKSSITGSRKKR